MARIIQFPKRPKIQGRIAAPPAAPVSNGQNRAWRMLWDNPVVHWLAILCLFFIICAWPLLRWVIAVDLAIQLLRLIFIGGMAGFVAVLHFLVVGIVAYLVLRSGGNQRR